MRPSNAVRTVWDAEAIDTSHIGFRPIQKIATIHASSVFIRGIPIIMADFLRSVEGRLFPFTIELQTTRFRARTRVATGVLYQKI